jgi:hypothetical protein
MNNNYWQKSKTYKQVLDQDTVVNFSSDETFKIKILLEAANNYIKNNFTSIAKNLVNAGHSSLPDSEKNDRWIEDGVEAEILEPKSSWKKGKARLRVVLEFYPEELRKNQTDVSLDDIRQDI